MNYKSNDPGDIVTHALEIIKAEEGENFSLENVSVARMVELTHLSRSKVRRLKKNNFKLLPNGNKGKKKAHTVISGYEAVIDNFLKSSVTNSEVIFQRLKDLGYTGSISGIKRYIQSHKDLIPAKREIVAPQGSRGQRYTTGPGECYQMDWGFVNVNTAEGTTYRVACFVMICHHCGMRYVEFFPNAKQENLFIGMIHAFEYMGVPQYVLTDNMKSVVISRDMEGKPIWNKEYDDFMKAVGFRTRLCKAYHPFTKGAVERCVRFVKENFVVGRVFGNITDLNIEVRKWCDDQNRKYHRAVDCIPSEKHGCECMRVASIVTMTLELTKYLCPIRKISFDGFVEYEGRRFGVPHTYKPNRCRVCREDFYLTIYDLELTQKLCVHNVTWSKKASFTANQYVDQPEEFPTATVHAELSQKPEKEHLIGFDRFDFGKKVKWDD